MKNKIIAVVVAFALLIVTMLTAETRENCTHISVHAHAIVRMMTEASVCSVTSCTPINHNWQEYAIISNKIHEMENPADYMDGLTAISKRCIYVGEAEHCRLPVKMTI